MGEAVMNESVLREMDERDLREKANAYDEMERNIRMAIKAVSRAKYEADGKAFYDHFDMLARILTMLRDIDDDRHPPDLYYDELVRRKHKDE